MALKQKSVVIGMTGKLDSVVAAYLIKKQGYDCHAVAVNNFDKIEGIKRTNDGLSEKEEVVDLSIRGDCHLPDLNKIKEICLFLEIPFYVANASDKYYEEVLGQMVAARISGQLLSPCVYCHRLMIDVLIAKADSLGASFVATGHYAKIQASRKVFHVQVANDLKNDQSYYLGRLGQEHLSRLILPLSEMRRSETQKIAASLGIPVVESRPQDDMCYRDDPKVPDLIEWLAPETLRKKGQVLSYASDVYVADHPGVHHYALGQTKIVTQEKIAMTVAPNLGEGSEVVEYNAISGAVFMGQAHKLTYDRCLLGDLQWPNHFDISRPFMAYVRFKSGGDFIPCRIYPKNNHKAVVAFGILQRGLIHPGPELAIYTDNVLGSKLVALGKILDYGPFDNKELLYENLEQANRDEMGRKALAIDRNQKLEF